MAGWGWLAGAVLLAIYKLAAYLWWRRRVFRWNSAPAPALTLLAEQAATQAGLSQSKPLPLYENAAVPTAMLVELWHTVLLVPRHFAESPQAALVLLHEYTHFCRRDLLKKLVLQAAVCLHWFNPAVWWLDRCAQQEIELACDECVLALAGPTARADYSHALLGAASGRAPCLVTQFGNGKRLMRLRLANLFAIGKRRGRVIVALCLLAAVSAGLFVACGTAETTEQTPPAASAVSAEPSTAADDVCLRQAYDFAAWLLSSNLEGRYQETFAADPDQLPEAVQRWYYEPAAQFATPELIDRLTRDRLPVSYDKEAFLGGYLVSDVLCELRLAADRAENDDPYDLNIQLKVTTQDGVTTDHAVSMTVFMDKSGPTPLIRSYRFTKGWPLEIAAPAATPAPALVGDLVTLGDEVYRKGADGAYYHLDENGNLDDSEPVKIKVEVVQQTAPASILSLDEVRLIVPLPVTEMTTSSAAYTNFSKYAVCPLKSLQPGSFATSAAELMQLNSNTILNFYLSRAPQTPDGQYTVTTGNFRDPNAAIAPEDAALQVGLLNADGTALYLLDGPVLANHDSGYFYTVLVRDLPKGDYTVALVNGSEGKPFSGALYYNLIGTSGSNHIYKNTAFNGDDQSDEIFTVDRVTARSIKELTDPLCVVTGTSFDPQTKVMTIRCATSGMDADGHNQQGSATFKIKLP